MAEISLEANLWSLQAHRKLQARKIDGVPGYDYIYQRQKTKHGTITRRIRYYVTSNPRTPAQQANRARVRDAVRAWKNLTDSQKQIYNKRSVKAGLTGYVLHLREFMNKK